LFKFAQAVIAEAEPHRRRFPNFCLRKVLAIHQLRDGLYGVYSHQRPVRGRARPPAGDAALGIVVLTS
jgi:hypothetical protein